MMSTIDLSKWSLIPGLTSDPPSSSLNLNGLIEYSPVVVAEAISAFPGMVVQKKAEPSWWHWRATWQAADRHIGVGMSLFETDPVSWGGSPLQGICDVSDILGLWDFVRRRCPGVWMHNSDCEIHTPETFKRLFVS